MSIPLIINGVTYNYPQEFDTHWGPTLTAWSTAVTNGMLQKAGGSFSLTSEVDFGATFGLRTAYVKSEESNIASTGFFRLANNSTGVGFRNSTNSADLLLTVNTSNQLTFNGLPIGATTALLNTHILVGNASNQPADVAMSGDTTITNTGIVTIANSAINNAKISSSAAIDLSKLASVVAFQWVTGDFGGVLGGTSVTANRAIASDSNGLPVASSVTDTELGYVSGATSNLQAQIDAIQGIPSGTIADYAGTTPPSGWLVCDGSSLLRASYPALFTAIGTTWGAADGAHFNIPALSRRVSVGSGGTGSGTLGNTVGSLGGTETVTAIQNSHTHTENSHTHSLASTGTTAGQNYSGANTVGSLSGGNNEIRVDAAGGGETFDKVSRVTGTQTDTGMSSTTATNQTASVIQPSAVVLKIIKT